MDLEITQDVLPAGDLFDHYAGYADRYYKPAMIRNESLQRTRNVLTKMAKEKAIKSKISFICAIYGGNVEA